MSSTLVRAVLLLSLCGAFSTSRLCAGDPPPSIVELIDAQIDKRLADAGVTPAEPLEAAALLRRTMLDLAGRIPTAQEAADFAALDAVDKREQLIDGLIASPDFAFHLRNELDILLLARKTHDDSWREYLLAACRENRPWDAMFRELLLPEYERPEEKGLAAFIGRRVQSLDDLTNDTSSLLFGVNIGCAKCHDHPLVPDWEQQHYFGMARFFKQTYRTRPGFLAERPDGELKFTDVGGTEHTAELMFLTGTKVDAPPQKLSDDELKKINEMITKAQREDDAERPPLPEFSPRKALVELALAAASSDTQRSNLVARNIVNRTWARLMGRGLVHPLDQIHSENPPSHPELLDALSDDFQKHGYDLRQLVRNIVLSRAYARSSQWASEETRPAAELYAVAAPRPLAPRQLALSLVVASTAPDKLPGLEKPEDWAQKREQLENQSNNLSRRLEIPDDGFQVAAEEALFFSNASQFENDYLRDGGGSLVGALKTIDDQQAITAAFMATLIREPNEDERQALGQYLSDRSDRRTGALRQVVWALLASPEFRFNH